MVTISDVGNMGFLYFEEYFEYIIDSKINGQHKQAKALFNKLSSRADVSMSEKSQRDEFFEWAETFLHYEAQDNEFGSITEELEKYFGYTYIYNS